MLLTPSGFRVFRRDVHVQVTMRSIKPASFFAQRRLMKYLPRRGTSFLPFFVWLSKKASWVSLGGQIMRKMMGTLGKYGCEATFFVSKSFQQLLKRYLSS